MLTGRKPVFCRRCGWRARRAWLDSEIKDAYDSALLSGGTIDPELEVLDRVRAHNAIEPVGTDKSKSKPKSSKRKRAPRKKKGAEQAPPAPVVAPRSPEFDLPAFEWGLPAKEATENSAMPTPVNMAGWDERTRTVADESLQRLQRRQIVGTIAMTALALFLFSLLTINKSCDVASGM